MVRLDIDELELGALFNLVAVELDEVNTGYGLGSKEYGALLHGLLTKLEAKLEG